MGERTCGTMAVHERLLKEDPSYAKNRKIIEAFTQRYVRRYLRAGLRTGVVHIPVVVHVVYNTAAQNISDAQIQSQIDVLNADYRRLNADAGLVPAVFQPVAADARIEFGLAVRDPNCQQTSGITRTQTTVTSFTFDDKVKHAAQGGHDAWPADRYLNLWVCRLGGGLLGYAQFPGGAAATDGVVITYTAFGTMGTAAAPFDRGRTATHEIGHWLNLRHIWGDAVGCATDDGVADTPVQDDEHYGCPAFPQVSCNNGPNGDMFMNYMDYTDDPCMYMFTAGQSSRMDACLAEARASLLASDGLTPPPPVAAADLWSADTPDELGDEPNNVTVHFWQSDDIWVRRQNDGMTIQDHENPIYRPAGPPNYVYVRVRNRSCSTSGSGTVKLYWAKASSALGWPAPWDGSVVVPALMGGMIGSQPTGAVPGRGSVVLAFSWNPPNPADYASFGADKSHFCLLSRIETAAAAPFGMTFPEMGNLGLNVKNNNNIVWKNISIAEAAAGGGKIGWLTVGKLIKGNWQMKLEFAQPALQMEPIKGVPRSVFEWGTVEVFLGKELFARWVKAGHVGNEVKPLPRYRLAVLGPKAFIGPLDVKPGELFTIAVRFLPDRERKPGTFVFPFHVIQYAVEGRKETVLGGVKFILRTAAKE